MSYSTNLLQFVLTGTLGNGLDGLSLHALPWLVSSAVVAGVAGVAGMAGVAGVAGMAGVAGVAAPWAMPLLPTAATMPCQLNNSAGSNAASTSQPLIGASGAWRSWPFAGHKQWQKRMGRGRVIVRSDVNHH